MAVARCCGGRAVTSSSPKRIGPASTRTKPAIERSSVVLPQPEGPRMAVRRPAANASETPRNASTEP